MSLDKQKATEPGPSREELRQAVKSKVTPEFSSATPTPEQEAQRAIDDARVAELRTSLGLEPELSSRPGVQDFLPRPEKEGTFNFIPEPYGSMPIPARRSEYANQEAGEIRFNAKKFGLDLVNDPDMKTLIGQYREAQSVEAQIMREGYGELVDAKHGPFKYPLLKRMSNNVRLALGGNKTIEKGSQAIRHRTDLGNHIVSLMLKKFDGAGFNEAPNTPLTAENTNLGRAQEILGIPLL